MPWHATGAELRGRYSAECQQVTSATHLLAYQVETEQVIMLFRALATESPDTEHCSSRTLPRHLCSNMQYRTVQRIARIAMPLGAGGGRHCVGMQVSLVQTWPRPLAGPTPGKYVVLAQCDGAKTWLAKIMPPKFIQGLAPPGPD